MARPRGPTRLHGRTRIHTHTHTYTEPPGGASRILRHTSSSPYRGESVLEEGPPVLPFGRGRGSGDFESEPPSIMGVGSVLTPSLLAAAAAAVSTTGEEGGGYGDEEEEQDDEITDETPFLREQRRRNLRRPLSQRCVGGMNRL